MRNLNGEFKDYLKIKSKEWSKDGNNKNELIKKKKKMRNKKLIKY